MLASSEVDWGPDRIKQKTVKLVFAAPLLSTQHSGEWEKLVGSESG